MDVGCSVENEKNAIVVPRKSQNFTLLFCLSSLLVVMNVISIYHPGEWCFSCALIGSFGSD